LNRFSCLASCSCLRTFIQWSSSISTYCLSITISRSCSGTCQSTMVRSSKCSSRANRCFSTV